MDPMNPQASPLPSSDSSAGHTAAQDGSEAILVSYDTAAADAPSMLMNIAPIAAMIAIFYFLLIRPQQAERKQHETLLASLKKGDAVVTASGLHGVVHEVKGDIVSIEVADKLRLTVDRASIKRKAVPSAESGS